jgi:hypothetical protein
VVFVAISSDEKARLAQRQVKEVEGVRTEGSDGTKSAITMVTATKQDGTMD